MRDALLLQMFRSISGLNRGKLLVETLSQRPFQIHELDRSSSVAPVFGNLKKNTVNESISSALSFKAQVEAAPFIHQVNIFKRQS